MNLEAETPDPLALWDEIHKLRAQLQTERREKEKLQQAVKTLGLHMQYRRDAGAPSAPGTTLHYVIGWAKEHGA